MIPIYLDPAHVRVALIGRAERAARRLSWLKAAGMQPELFSDEPAAELQEAAGAALQQRLPTTRELAGFHAIWIADLPLSLARGLASTARAVHTPVNVEDVPALCDFHTPAVVRRGELTLAAGTGGASPAVARAARERLEQAFEPGWGEALGDIARARLALREAGVDAEALSADARQRLALHGLG